MKSGAGGGSQTHTALRPTDFEAVRVFATILCFSVLVARIVKLCK